MTKRYENPPILDGYKHVMGKWNNGFVIERRTDGSQLVWAPVGSLDADGTLDGKRFTEQFGRRNYRKDKFSDTEYNEPLTEELLEQKESVEKYGGFYFSRYNISKSFDGKPQSIVDAAPWVNINFEDAQSEAAKFECGEAVKSHLTFGAEYDSVLAWILKSGAKTFEEIAKNSGRWGNYKSGEVLKTGSCEKWHVNNICDFAGNVAEWTQENNARLYRVIRGGSCNVYSPVAARDYFYHALGFPDTSFRIAIYIK